MANQIKLKNASGSNPSASDLVIGEVALRTDNASLFTKKDDGTIAEIGAAAGVSDGDKGDITVSNSGATFTVDNGVISTAKIASDAVTTDKINANAITATEISNGVITNDKIASNAAIAVSKLSGVMPSGGGTFSGNISFSDDRKIKLGSSDDLVLFHDGTNSMIDNDTGDLKISSSGTLRLRGNSVSIQNENQTETMAFFSQNGAAKLYFDNVEKFETTSYGNLSAAQVRVASSNASTVAFSVGDVGTGFYNSGSNAIGYSANGTQKWNINSSGSLTLVDGVSLNIGTSSDLQIYHNGSTSYIDEAGTGALAIRSNQINFDKYTGEALARFRADGSCELFHDNSSKFNTESNGVTVTGRIKVTGNNNVGLIHEDGVKAVFGDSNDLEISHSSDVTRIRNTNDSGTLKIQATSNGENAINIVPNGEVELFHNGNKKFYTLSTGAYVEGFLLAPDNGGLKLGSGNDLVITHDGTNSFITDGGNSTGLVIKTPLLAVKNAAGSENMLVATQDGSVELMHNNSKKIETSSSGVSVTGNIVVSGNVDGRNVGDDGTKLDTIETNATADQTASEILTLLKTVDGAGSGLDADTLDGVSAGGFLSSDNPDTASEDITFDGGAGAVSIAANSDIRFASGTWSGEHAGKIQHHANIFYIQGGSNGIQLRGSDGGSMAAFQNTQTILYDDVNFEGGAGAVSVNAGSDIRFATGNWTGNACKIQQHGDALYIQGGSASDYNIILRSNSGNDRLYMSGGGVLYPTVDNSQDLGKSSKRFANVFAGAFYGDGSNLTGISSTNNFVSSASFNTGNGVLTLNRSGLGAVTVDLDGRFATGTIPTNNNQLSNGAGYLTTVHSARSASTNGYVRYRDGTQIAYGNVNLSNGGWTTKSFATAFPSVCRAVVTVPNDSTATAAAQRNHQVRSVNRSNFQGHSGQHTNPCNHFYIAIGY